MAFRITIMLFKKSSGGKRAATTAPKTTCGVYVAWHRWLDSENGPQRLFKVGFSQDLARRLTDDTYTTAFAGSWKYEATFETLNVDEARLLEKAVLHCMSEQRMDSRSELVEVASLDQLLDVVKLAAEATGVKTKFYRNPKYAAPPITLNAGGGKKEKPVFVHRFNQSVVNLDKIKTERTKLSTVSGPGSSSSSTTTTSDPFGTGGSGKGSSATPNAATSSSSHPFNKNLQGTTQQQGGGNFTDAMSVEDIIKDIVHATTNKKLSEVMPSGGPPSWGSAAAVAAAAAKKTSEHSASASRDDTAAASSSVKKGTRVAYEQPSDAMESAIARQQEQLFLKYSLQLGNNNTDNNKGGFGLRQYQHEASGRIISELDKKGKCILHMACRCGKTPVAFSVMNAYMSAAQSATTTTTNGSLIVFLVPSLSLLRQTVMKAGAFNLRRCSILAIGSDPRPIQLHSSAVGGEAALNVQTTTDPAVVQQFMKMSSDDTSSSSPQHKVVFSTYHSSQLLQEYHHMADLTVFDEAHRLCGSVADQSTSFKALFLNDLRKKEEASQLTGGVASVGKQHRLFMTATPSYDGDITMNDKSVFGGIAYSYHLRRGVDEGYVNPFKLRLVVAPPESSSADASTFSLNPAGGHVDAAEPLYTQQLLTCMETVDKLLVFSNTIEHAEAMCSALQEAAEITAGKRGNAATGLKPFKCIVVHSQMSSSAPADALNLCNDPNTRLVIFNCRLFQEGVELPHLNAVFFAARKGSPKEIVQSVCRPLNKLPGKAPSTVFIPVAHDTKHDVDDVVNLEPFSVLVPITEALMHEDSTLYKQMMDPYSGAFDVGVVRTARLKLTNEQLQTVVLPVVRRVVQTGSTASVARLLAEGIDPTTWQRYNRLAKPENIPWADGFGELKRIVTECIRYPRSSDDWVLGDVSVNIYQVYKRYVKGYLMHQAVEEYEAKVKKAQEEHFATTDDAADTSSSAKKTKKKTIHIPSQRPPDSFLEPNEIADLETLPEWKTYGVHGSYLFDEAMEFLRKYLADHNGTPPMYSLKCAYMGLDATPMERFVGVMMSVNLADTAELLKLPKSKQDALDAVCAPYGIRWRKERGQDDRILATSKKLTMTAEAGLKFRAHVEMQPKDENNRPQSEYLNTHFPGFPEKHSSMENLAVQVAGLAPRRRTRSVSWASAASLVTNTTTTTNEEEPSSSPPSMCTIPDITPPPPPVAPPPSSAATSTTVAAAPSMVGKKVTAKVHQAAAPTTQAASPTPAPHDERSVVKLEKSLTADEYEAIANGEIEPLPGTEEYWRCNVCRLNTPMSQSSVRPHVLGKQHHKNLAKLDLWGERAKLPKKRVFVQGVEQVVKTKKKLPSRKQQVATGDDDKTINGDDAPTSPTSSSQDAYVHMILERRKQKNAEKQRQQQEDEVAVSAAVKTTVTNNSDRSNNSKSDNSTQDVDAPTSRVSALLQNQPRASEAEIRKIPTAAPKEKKASKTSSAAGVSTSAARPPAENREQSSALSRMALSTLMSQDVEEDIDGMYSTDTSAPEADALASIAVAPSAPPPPQQQVLRCELCGIDSFPSNEAYQEHLSSNAHFQTELTSRLKGKKKKKKSTKNNESPTSAANVGADVMSSTTQPLSSSANNPAAATTELIDDEFFVGAAGTNTVEDNDDEENDEEAEEEEHAERAAPPPPKLRCEICDLDFPNHTLFASHISGKKHKKAEEEFHKFGRKKVNTTKKEKQEVSATTKKKKKKSATGGGDAEENKKLFVCEVCCMSFGGEDNYRDHINSKKHLRMVKLKEEERLNSTSFGALLNEGQLDPDALVVE